ncbi:hypothetical protein KCP74_20145 [Salmonella enterica subsp. enterica]|nr:hypothetical protein KCP74_20145 [Salmonella enterica subsp. enterica]
MCETAKVSVLLHRASQAQRLRASFAGSAVGLSNSSPTASVPYNRGRQAVYPCTGIASIIRPGRYIRPFQSVLPGQMSHLPPSNRCTARSPIGLQFLLRVNLTVAV